MADRQSRQHAPLRHRDRCTLRPHAHQPAVLRLHRLPGGGAPALNAEGWTHGLAALKEPNAGITASTALTFSQVPTALAGHWVLAVGCPSTLLPALEVGTLVCLLSSGPALRTCSKKGGRLPGRDPASRSMQKQMPSRPAVKHPTIRGRNARAMQHPQSVRPPPGPHEHHVQKEREKSGCDKDRQPLPATRTELPIRSHALPLRLENTRPVSGLTECSLPTSCGCYAPSRFRSGCPAVRLGVRATSLITVAGAVQGLQPSM